MTRDVTDSEFPNNADGDLYITPTLGPNRIKIDMRSSSKKQALKELSALLAEACPNVSSKEIYLKMRVREQLATTAIGRGVAFPHARFKRLESMCAAIGISRKGVPFDAIDDDPVNIFFALLAPLTIVSEQLKVLACASRLFKNPTIQRRLLESGTSLELYETIYDIENEDSNVPT